MSSSHPWLEHLKHTLSCQGSGIILEAGLEEMYIGRTYIKNITFFPNVHSICEIFHDYVSCKARWNLKQWIIAVKLMRLVLMFGEHKGVLHIWTHGSCDNIYRTFCSSNQTNSRHGGGRWVWNSIWSSGTVVNL